MNSDEPIEKRNITEGPEDMEKESTTKLNRKSDGSLEQVQVDQLATCPNCKAPVDDFSEKLLGTCAVQGCETYLCHRCGAIAECGKPLCRGHTEVIPDQNPGHEDSTIIACPEHAPVIWKSQNLIKLAALWKKKRKLDARKKEAKIQRVKALVPLYVKRMEGEIEQRRLRLKAYEIQKRHKIELLNADIKRELNKIKAEQVRSNERIEKKKIKARLKETLRKKEADLYKFNLLKKREERKREELTHKEDMDQAQLQLAQEKLEADKEQAKRETQVEMVDIVRKHTEEMKKIGVEKNKEERKTARLAHDINKENRELDLEEEKLRSAREIAEKKLGVRAAELKEKAIKDVGELAIKDKAERRKNEALQHEKKKDAFQLMLEGERVQLNADELALEKEKADREFKKELLKMDLEKRMHDEDVRAELQEQANKSKNEKAKRLLDFADLVRKEKKDLRDYYLRAEKLNEARRRLSSGQEVDTYEKYR